MPLCLGFEALLYLHLFLEALGFFLQLCSIAAESSLLPLCLVKPVLNLQNQHPERPGP